MATKKGNKARKKTSASKATAKKKTAAKTAAAETTTAETITAAAPEQAAPQAGAETAAQPETTADNTPEFDNIGVLGHVGWLMARDDELKGYFINDMEWRVMPPVAFGQFKLWHATAPDGTSRPVAYASWAMVGDRQKARIEAGNKRLSPAEWKSGDHKVMVDIITPFGGRDEVLKELGV
ncbi:MAG: toxin-activating lysine-acyltransferase [Alphaproteobacteria bacterium]|nr:toxin-activating lysine-acyltransferase [Alphaproteobacteria bacterium]